MGSRERPSVIVFGQIDPFVHPDDLEIATENLKNLLSGNAPLLNHEYRLLCNDGSYKWLLFRGKVIRYDSAGKPAHVAGTILDISEMRKYREMIELANRRLHLLNSITRHDLLNQLTILKGALDLLSEEPDSG